jgi:hypothetical protein
MKLKQKILEFIRKAYEDDEGRNSASETSSATDDDRHAIRELFDGMSTGTARIIIEEEMSGQMGKDNNIDLLENKGRYYVARIVQADGRAIRLLIDKQTGKVQFEGR